MSGVFPCPCNELKLLQEEVKLLREFVEEEIYRVLVKEIVPERKRISKIEAHIRELKDSMRQITVSKVEGTWGIVDKRADIIYSRLLAFPTNGNGNGKQPFFSTLDVKNIIGVTTYAQAKEAMLRCLERHPRQVLIVQRGQKKIGIALKKEENIMH